MGKVLDGWGVQNMIYSVFRCGFDLQSSFTGQNYCEGKLHQLKQKIIILKKVFKFYYCLTPIANAGYFHFNPPTLTINGPLALMKPC